MNKNARPGREKSIEQLEAEAADTRRRVSEDVEALSEKLSPEHIKEQAKSAVKGAAARTVEGAKTATTDAVTRVKESAGGALDTVRHDARQVVGGSRRVAGDVVTAARENPIPTAMVGIGVGWLVYSALAKRTAASADVEAGEQRLAAASHNVASRVNSGARAAGHRVGETYRDNPLVVGAATMGAGVMLGMMLPHTQAEDEWVGGFRDKLLLRAEEQGRHVLEKGKRAAASAADAAKSELHPAQQRQTR